MFQEVSNTLSDILRMNMRNARNVSEWVAVHQTTQDIASRFAELDPEFNQDHFLAGTVIERSNADYI